MAPATRTAAGGAICFAVLTLAVLFDLTGAADATALRALQTVRLGALDVLSTLLSILGAGPPVIAFLSVLGVLAFRIRGPGAFVPLAVLLAATALEATLKTLVAHPGPPHELSRTLPVPDWLRVLSPHFTNAFPSGHALRATFLLGLAVDAGRSVFGVAVLFAGAMWVSRIYLGDHWPSDVLGGIALGVAAAGVARRSSRG